MDDAQLPATRHGAFSAGASGLTEPELVLGVSAAGGVYPVTLMASALKSDFPVCSHLPVAAARELTSVASVLTQNVTADNQCFVSYCYWSHWLHLFVSYAADVVSSPLC